MKSLRRLLAVILKECTQIERDPSILLIGLFLPIFLLMLFGYGLSMDVKGVPVAIVTEDASPMTDRFTDRFLASDYFAARPVTSLIEAEALLRNREVDAVLHIPSDFARRVLAGEADLGLTIGTSEVGGRTYLSTINAVLGLASISGGAGSGIARIELNASLSSIGEDVFWNQEGNAYATYLAAHSGDAYTGL